MPGLIPCAGRGRRGSQKRHFLGELEAGPGGSPGECHGGDFPGVDVTEFLSGG